MTVRAWIQPRADRKLHGVVWMSDEQALDRLTRGQNWIPAEGEAAVIAQIQSELNPGWGEPGHIYEEFTMEGE